jgi:hypothetical protein
MVAVRDGRLERIVRQASKPLPAVPPLSNDPSLEEQVSAWRQHAANYADIALSLREALPELLAVVSTIQSELRDARREIGELKDMIRALAKP